MRRLLLLLVLISGMVSAQDYLPTFRKDYVEDEKKAKRMFQRDMNSFIRDNFVYPKEHWDKQGKVYFQLVITEKGTWEITGVRGSYPELEHLTIALLLKLPRIRPAIKDGKAVNIPFSMPITYSIK